MPRDSSQEWSRDSAIVAEVDLAWRWAFTGWGVAIVALIALAAVFVKSF